MQVCLFTADDEDDFGDDEMDDEGEGEETHPWDPIPRAPPEGPFGVDVLDSDLDPDDDIGLLLLLASCRTHMMIYCLVIMKPYCISIAIVIAVQICPDSHHLQDFLLTAAQAVKRRPSRRYGSGQI